MVQTDETHSYSNLLYFRDSESRGIAGSSNFIDFEYFCCKDSEILGTPSLFRSENLPYFRLRVFSPPSLDGTLDLESLAGTDSFYFETREDSKCSKLLHFF